ncbi:MAG TPA: methyltransferase domain-containing protein [Ktedonobacterales bacterium]|nr:methyltransferase domain-containing protein [Ktedonobacterales bacterium]
MEADNEIVPPTQRGDYGDFAAVDDAPDPQRFIRFLEQRQDSEAAQSRRQLSYELLEVREGQHLLDIGCGLGDDVRALARLVGASGRSVGLDNSERLLEVARARSAGVEYPGEFIHADMHHLPFDAASFDGCRAERILIHSAQPTQVLAEMCRVVRAGGHIVVTEPDLDTLVFHASAHAVVRKLTQWHSDRLRNGTIGRWLPELFRQCGLADVRVFPTVAQSAKPSAYARALAQRALEAGVLTSDEAQDILADWQRRAERQDFLEFGVFFTVAGRVREAAGA